MSKARNLVMGDLHGAYQALLQCLERSAFDYDHDRLIQLGDIADRHPQVYECVNELLKIKNLISIKGNHDAWLDEFIHTDYHPFSWNHGGTGTLISYLDHAGKSDRYFAKGNGFKTGLVSSDIPPIHRQFFNSQKLFYIDDSNRCFVHAGFKRSAPFQEQKTEDYYWDRTLWREALEHQVFGEPFNLADNFKEIYIGHTPTLNWGTDQPMQAYNIHNVDTGAGKHGRLTIMDIDTKEYWQSDLIADLYP